MNRKLSILIVDDSIGYARRMSSVLQESADVSRVDIAVNYVDATALLIKKPDLVLLDIRLPGKNGICILREIKETVKDCEVIIVSNDTGKYYQQLYRELGATSLLDKTNDFDLVPGIVKAMACKLQSHSTGELGVLTYWKGQTSTRRA